jgi:hypothetical protein
LPLALALVPDVAVPLGRLVVIAVLAGVVAVALLTEKLLPPSKFSRISTAAP